MFDDNILEINHVSKQYPNFNLQDVNIALPRGAIMGFIGENGAGKSTTIKLIMDLIRKDSGEIRVLGCENTKMDKNIREHIGVVLDECHFPEEMNLKNVSSVMKSFYKTWNARRFEEFVKEYKIPKDRKVKAFSRGMRMKLSMAVAMAHDTQLLILDEATSGLDPIVREEMLDLLMDFIQNENCSVFISSHILSDLEKICDYITFIHEGHILLSESKDELLERHGIYKCSEKDLRDIRRDALIGVHRYAYGVEALVLKDQMPANIRLEPANLEQIMLYYTKEAVR